MHLPTGRAGSCTVVQYAAKTSRVLTAFGNDAATSVLDINCKTHELDNLYVVDGSFFVSSGAVNPSLTIIANAIRVREHLIERMK